MATPDTEFSSVLARGLSTVGFAYVDGFLGEPLASYVRQEVCRCSSRSSRARTCTRPPHEMLRQLLHMHAQGDSLLPGELAGGKSGKNLRYTLPSVRGDLIRYVSGREEECHNIGLCSEMADQMMLKLKDMVLRPSPPARCEAAPDAARRAGRRVRGDGG